MPESTVNRLDPEIVSHVAGTCLCLHTQRAARALARLFDNALAPFGLTNGQYSLLMALNGSEPPSIGKLAEFLAMDRTSLTAALKPLERRGLVVVRRAQVDKRSRVVDITVEGVSLLKSAVAVWRDTHAQLDATLGGEATSPLRPQLQTLTRAAVSQLGGSAN